MVFCFPPRAKLYRQAALLLLAGVLAAQGACVPLSNRDYARRAADYRGIIRVAVFLRHWPCHRQFPGRPHLAGDFIGPDTEFFAPLEAARDPSPRAVDLAGLDDMVTETFLERLRDRGYEPLLAAAG